MKKTMRIVFALLLVAAMLAFPVGAIAESTHSGEAGALSGLSATSSETIWAGTYYIQNRKYKRFAQIDNNDSNNNYETDGAIIEQFPLDGESYQQWFITPTGSGYYKIMSNQSGLFLTVKSGDEHSNMGTIVQKSYSGSKNQQWKITKTSHGSYKIKARFSEDYSTDDLVLCVNTQGLHSVDGLDLKQRVFVDNTSYMDEWFLFADGSRIGIIGILQDSSGHDHKTWANSVLNSIAAKGDYSDVNCNLVYSMTLSQGLTVIKRSKIFAFFGHGYGNANESRICLGGSSYVSSVSIYNFNTKTVLQDLSNVHIAVYNGCNTAYGGTGSSAKKYRNCVCQSGSRLCNRF